MTSSFTVEDTFVIEGRGLIAAGVLEGPSHGFRDGARVVITRPDGTRLASAVRGARVKTACFGDGVNIHLLLADVSAPEEVPRGSVVTIDEE